MIFILIAFFKNSATEFYKTIVKSKKNSSFIYYALSNQILSPIFVFLTLHAMESYQNISRVFIVKK